MFTGRNLHVAFPLRALRVLCVKNSRNRPANAVPGNRIASQVRLPCAPLRTPRLSVILIPLLLPQNYPLHCPLPPLFFLLFCIPQNGRLFLSTTSALFCSWQGGRGPTCCQTVNTSFHYRPYTSLMPPPPLGCPSHFVYNPRALCPQTARGSVSVPACMPCRRVGGFEVNE